MGKKSKTASPSPETQVAAIKRCDICGEPSDSLTYLEGNATCTTCALAVQSDQNQAQADVPKPAKRKSKKERPAAAVPADGAPDDQPPAVSEANAEPGQVTLGQVCERYIAALEAGGEHSLGTMRGYAAELQLACREIGATMELQALKVDRVREYFECAAVTKLRSGEEKSPLGVAKTRRVLRLALVWSCEQGLVAQPPIPITEKA